MRSSDVWMSGLPRPRPTQRLLNCHRLNGVNAFDYLNQLQLHASDVADHPDHWMPWNYRDRLAVTKEVA
jgi:hypothetical protein